jgi:hypothetical protein
VHVEGHCAAADYLACHIINASAHVSLPELQQHACCLFKQRPFCSVKECDLNRFADPASPLAGYPKIVPGDAAFTDIIRNHPALGVRDPARRHWPSNIHSSAEGHNVSVNFIKPAGQLLQ